MGIPNLMTYIQPILKHTRLRKYKGDILGIDANSWIYSSVRACAVEVCKGVPTTEYIDNFMNRINKLRDQGLRFILVFDGDRVPMKKKAKEKKEERKKKARDKAKVLEEEGKFSEAKIKYENGVEVDYSVIHDLIQVLSIEKIDYVVAPYEADAQLAFMLINKEIDAVVTGDTDLIAYGCTNIIFDMKRSHGDVFHRSDLLKDKNFEGFTEAMILDVCLLCGSDYSKPMPGVRGGINVEKACGLIRKHGSHQNVLKDTDPSYVKSFKKAFWAFKHHVVYDAELGKTVHLSEPVDVNEEDMNSFGILLSQDEAFGVATGNLHPSTKKPMKVTNVAAIKKAQDGYYNIENYNLRKELKRKEKAEKKLKKNMSSDEFEKELEKKRKSSSSDGSEEEVKKRKSSSDESEEVKKRKSSSDESDEELKKRKKSIQTSNV